MKKSIWGYNVEEVDTTLEMLSNQNAALIQHNDYMEDETKNLLSQLDDAKASLAQGMTKADADAYKELKIAYAALQDRMQSCNDELEMLKAQKDELLAQRDELAAEMDELAAEKDQLVSEKDQLSAQKNEILAERNAISAARDELAQVKDDLMAQKAALTTQQEELRAQFEELNQKAMNLENGNFEHVEYTGTEKPQGNGGVEVGQLESIVKKAVTSAIKANEEAKAKASILNRIKVICQKFKKALKE